MAKKKMLKLQMNNSGYLLFGLCENDLKSYCVSRFVFETFKGMIPVDKEVDHIDNDKKNNNINNLQLLTHTENIKKNHFKRKVISFNIETKEKKIFNSIKETAEFYGIFSSNICLNCQKKIKTCKSKKDGMKYIFNYIELNN